MSVEELVGAPLAHAEPPVVDRTATMLVGMASTASELRIRLLGADADLWEGQAANAFRRAQQDELPPQLQKLSTSFERCGDALGRYGRRVSELQGEARALAGELSSARSEQSRRAGILDRAAAAVVAATKRLHASVEPSERAARQAEVGRAKSALVAAKGAKSEADARVRRAFLSGDRIRADHDAAIGVCHAAIEEAADAGIKNTIFSTIERHASEISRQYVLPALEALGGVLEVISLVTAVAGGILLLASLVFPPLAALAGVFGMVALITGALGLALGTMSFGLKGLDPTDTRSDAEIANEQLGLIVSGVMMIVKPLRVVKKIGPVDRKLSSIIARNGRADPPRVYMNAPRRAKKDDVIDTVQDFLWTGADLWWNPDARGEQMTTDAEAARRDRALEAARRHARLDARLHCAPPSPQTRLLVTPSFRYFSGAPLAR